MVHVRHVQDAELLESSQFVKSSINRQIQAVLLVERVYVVKSEAKFLEADLAREGIQYIALDATTVLRFGVVMLVRSRHRDPALKSLQRG